MLNSWVMGKKEDDELFNKFQTDARIRQVEFRGKETLDALSGKKKKEPPGFLSEQAKQLGKSLSRLYSDESPPRFVPDTPNTGKNSPEYQEAYASANEANLNKDAAAYAERMERKKKMAALGGRTK